MLKGFVSGEEKDIVRIPMKGRNLAPTATYTNAVTDSKTFFRPWIQLRKNNTNVTTKAFSDIDSSGTYSFGFTVSEDIDEIRLIHNGTNRNLYPVDIFGSFAFGDYVLSGAFTGTNPSEVGGLALENIMLNTGNQALPYEPYGYQEGWEVRDNQDRLIWGREDELQTATGTLPFKGYGLPVKVKSLLSNAFQNGTPAPDNIIMPEMCGVRTGNLISLPTVTATIDGLTVSSNAESITISGNATTTTESNSAWKQFDFTLEAGEYAFSLGSPRAYQNGYAPRLHKYDDDSVICDYLAGGSISSITFTLSERTHVYVAFYINDKQLSNDKWVFMLNLGSTALPYEPYGWKVPFENHGENLWSEDYTGISTSLKYVPVYVGDGSFTLSTSCPAVEGAATLFLLAGNVQSGASTVSNGVYKDRPITVASSDGYVTVAYRYISYTTGSADPRNEKTMLTPGSTPKPYSPYLNETLPVYLGEVPTVRRVRKLEVRIDRMIDLASGYAGAVTKAFTQYALYLPVGFCDVLPYGSTSIVNSFYVNQKNAVFVLNAGTTLEEAKTLLNGHFIWYVLETPETTISNEPLCKISTYADELTTIQVHGLSAPLCGIGDYKDTLNLSTGVVTRKVKKLVLDGTENWSGYGSSASGIGASLLLSDVLSNSRDIGFCTHFQPQLTPSQSAIDGVTFGAGNKALYITFSVASASALNVTDTASFKAFLASQYANGTPVTVWYVLETPTTETVTVPTGMTGEIEGYLTQVSTPTPTNRSVPKWNGVEETGSTYAVTVYTPPEIPTTTGENTLTVETEKIHGLTNPLCGIGDYKDVLNLSTGVITRKVKKLVLTGDEAWQISEAWKRTSTSVFYFASSDIINISTSTSVFILSDRFKAASRDSLYNGDSDMIARTGTNAITIRVSDSIATTSTDLKSYLAAQYQAGTPVTIWYVLSAPTTETITVPYGLECSIEGYLTQSGTPAPSSPITPDSNGILESGGTYAVEVSLVPSNLTVKGHIKELT